MSIIVQCNMARGCYLAAGNGLLQRQQAEHSLGWEYSWVSDQPLGPEFCPVKLQEDRSHQQTAAAAAQEWIDKITLPKVCTLLHTPVKPPNPFSPGYAMIQSRCAVSMEE